MIVCDRCRSVEVPASECQILVNKTDAPKKGAKSAPRTMITIPLHLCENCIDKTNKELWGFVRSLHKTTEEKP